MAEGIPARTEGRWFAPLAAIAAAFTVLAIAAVVVVAVPLGPKSTTDNGPIHGLQAFADAVRNRDWQVADQYLSILLLKNGETSEDAFRPFDSYSIDAITLVDETESTADVRATVTYQRSSTFVNGQQVLVSMVPEGNVWKVASAFWYESPGN